MILSFNPLRDVLEFCSLLDNNPCHLIQTVFQLVALSHYRPTDFTKNLKPQVHVCESLSFIYRVFLFYDRP